MKTQLRRSIWRIRTHSDSVGDTELWRDTWSDVWLYRFEAAGEIV